MFWRRFVILIFIGAALSACGAKSTPTRRPPSTLTPVLTLPTATPLPADTPLWFREVVLYQIAPRSFYDSNGDGVGDLAGVTQQLDYLRGLGVTALWLTPVFSATSYHGYDVTDHFSIASDLGTQEDLVALVNEAHTRQMRVILSLVAGRTSNKHPFFLDAYRKPDSFYSDWYVWENAAHSAYKYASTDSGSPVLNMDNPVVQRYILEMARYWMDLDNDGDLTDGIDGFFDDAPYASHEFWAALRTEVKAAYPDFVLVGSASEKEPDRLAAYYENQFDALLDFPLYSVLAGNPDKVGDGVLNGQGVPAAVIGQLSRQAQLFPPSYQIVRFASDDRTNRIASKVKGDLVRAKQAAALLLTLPGTPLIYYGEEIGMKGSLGAGTDAGKYRQEPMDWHTAETGPGMAIWFKPKNRNNRADDGVSVEEQTGQPDSLLEAYRTMIVMRREHPALTVGGFQAVEASQCNGCLAYWRWDENDLYLLLFNFANETQSLLIDFTALPRPARGAGKDILRGGVINIPSNGRYTSTIEAGGTRIMHWGKP